MDGQFAVQLSFITYLGFFGWLGFRRGVTRELIVFVAGLAGWLVLTERGQIVINIANLSSATMEFAKAGGFNGNEAEAFSALTNAPALVPAGQHMMFLYFVWVVGLVLVYLGANAMVSDERSKRNLWAFLIGMFNGLFFAIIFLPGMAALVSSGEAEIEAQENMDLLGVLEKSSGLAMEGASVVWETFEPLGTNSVVIVVTAILIVAALSVGSGAKAKS